MPRSRLMPLLLLVFTSVSLAAVPVPKPPAIDARAYVLVDFQSGRVLAGDKADAQMEPASITKLMTGYVVFRALKEKRLLLSDNVVISERAWKAEGSRTFAQVGTQIPVDVLIKGMIVQSGNDATIALAEKVGGTEDGFVQMMNTYAQELGLKNSHFNDSSGLPGPTHYMSAHDIAMLSRVLIRDYPEEYKWYSLREFEYGGIKQQNRNGLLARDPSVDGIKTGHTESAGYCLASSAKRGDMRLIAVVLGTKGFKAARGRQRRAAQLRLHVLRNRQGQGRGRRGAQARGLQGRGRPRHAGARARCVRHHQPRIGGAAQHHGDRQGTRDRTHQGRPGTGRAHGERWQGCRGTRTAGREGSGARRRLVDAHGGRHRALDEVEQVDRWASRCRSVF